MSARGVRQDRRLSGEAAGMPDDIMTEKFNPGTLKILRDDGMYGYMTMNQYLVLRPGDPVSGALVKAGIDREALMGQTRARQRRAELLGRPRDGWSLTDYARYCLEEDERSFGYTESQLAVIQSLLAYIDTHRKTRPEASEDARKKLAAIERLINYFNLERFYQAAWLHRAMSVKELYNMMEYGLIGGGGRELGKTFSSFSSNPFVTGRWGLVTRGDPYLEFVVVSIRKEYLERYMVLPGYDRESANIGNDHRIDEPINIEFAVEEECRVPVEVVEAGRVGRPCITFHNMRRIRHEVFQNDFGRFGDVGFTGLGPLE